MAKEDDSSMGIQPQLRLLENNVDVNEDNMQRIWSVVSLLACFCANFPETLLSNAAMLREAIVLILLFGID